MTGEYGLTAIKRTSCPERLYAVSYLVFGRLMLVQPLRRAFHRELSAREQQGLVDIPDLLYQ
jgi:hypothetical protein